MAATAAQTLIGEARCHGCYAGSIGHMMKISLLIRILNNFESMATDPQTLIAHAKCFLCHGVSMAEALELALLDLISQNASGGGGGGAGSGTDIGAADPEGVVTADPGIIYFATGSQTLWVKETGTGNTGWTQLI